MVACCTAMCHAEILYPCPSRVPGPARANTCAASTTLAYEEWQLPAPMVHLSELSALSKLTDVTVLFYIPVMLDGLPASVRRVRLKGPAAIGPGAATLCIHELQARTVALAACDRRLHLPATLQKLTLQQVETLDLPVVAVASAALAATHVTMVLCCVGVTDSDDDDDDMRSFLCALRGLAHVRRLDLTVDECGPRHLQALVDVYVLPLLAPVLASLRLCCTAGLAGPSADRLGDQLAECFKLQVVELQAEGGGAVSAALVRLLLSARLPLLRTADVSATRLDPLPSLGTAAALGMWLAARAARERSPLDLFTSLLTQEELVNDELWEICDGLACGQTCIIQL